MFIMDVLLDLPSLVCIRLGAVYFANATMFT